MAQAIQREIDPDFSSRKTLGLRGLRTVVTNSHDVSTATPGSNLIVRVPRLEEGEVIVPNSLCLLFDFELKITGGNSLINYPVVNLGRALVQKMTVRLGSEMLSDINFYDIFKIYEDLFLQKDEREDRRDEGVHNAEFAKHRYGVTAKDDTKVNAKAIGELLGNKYKMRLEHEALDGHGAFYPHALNSVLEFNFKLAPAKDVVIGGDASKIAYRLSNIELRMETIRSEVLSQKAMERYSSRAIPYDKVSLAEQGTFDEKTTTSLTLKVHDMFQSLRGVLVFFKEDYNAGARDSESYYYPNISNVKVSINGNPNRVYSNGMKPIDMWRETRRFFEERGKTKSEDMRLDTFFSNKKFALFIDLRTMNSKEIHGDGQPITNGKSGVQIHITRPASTTSKNIKWYMFTISDAVALIENSSIRNVVN